MARVELLAPARDLECGRAAIDCGADAVYIGAPRFGARAAAGNRLEDIAELASYAHRYWTRVYATVNTLLRDDEVADAVRLAWELHEAGIDGLIIQDTGLLERKLPPLPLIASTQMHNHTPERVAFLEAVGFSRAILARELDLEAVRAIRRAAPRIELEFFVHGALCVCYSGQCLLSYALGGRSGNRGECAQPCRKAYTLVDASGRALVSNRHLLSPRDLNLSDHLGALLDAGVTSFKIEGRLKDSTYVANTVAHYSALLDALGVERASSGRSTLGFAPDPAKSFNRGFTTYFLHGRGQPVGSHSTPKAMGEQIGRVSSVDGGLIAIDEAGPLAPGDGLCWFDAGGRLRGARVNEVRGGNIVLEAPEGLGPGTLVYRNHNRRFVESVRAARPSRRIAVTFAVYADRIAVEDEDGIRADAPLSAAAPAEKPEAAMAAIHKQLAKTGGTEFACASVVIACDEPPGHAPAATGPGHCSGAAASCGAGLPSAAGPSCGAGPRPAPGSQPAETRQAAAVTRESNSRAPFLPVAALNAARREVLDGLRAAREAARARPSGGIAPNDAPFPSAELTYLGNVLNRAAGAFYRRHGVVTIEPAAESGLDLRGRKVMTTRYCLKHELGWCVKYGGAKGPAEPLALIDAEGRRLELRFDCRRCEMEVIYVR